MKKENYILGILLLLFLVSACRKEADNVTQQAINGMVYNQCTDSGLANIPVYFQIYEDNNLIQNTGTTSGINGAFSFANMGIHSNSKYSYSIYIPSKSGIGGGK